MRAGVWVAVGRVVCGDWPGVADVAPARQVRTGVPGGVPMAIGVLT